MSEHFPHDSADETTLLRIVDLQMQGVHTRKTPARIKKQVLALRDRALDIQRHADLEPLRRMIATVENGFDLRNLVSRLNDAELFMKTRATSNDARWDRASLCESTKTEYFRRALDRFEELGFADCVSIEDGKLVINDDKLEETMERNGESYDEYPNWENKLGAEPNATRTEDLERDRETGYQQTIHWLTEDESSF